MKESTIHCKSSFRLGRDPGWGVVLHICPTVIILPLTFNFFIYLWLFAVSLTLFLMTVYPDFIAPLFDKYTPMPDGQLRCDINAETLKNIDFSFNFQD